LTESHFQLADPVQTRQFVTRMSVDRLRLMLIAMSQAESVAPAALARDKERVDVQVLDEREGRDVVEDVAVEMEDYWGAKENGTDGAAVTAEADIDMIE
jgi:hypothetical protein